MRDFVAILPAVYLVDPVLFWVLGILFFRWYDDSSGWVAFMVETIAAVLLGLACRVVQTRRPTLLGTVQGPDHGAEYARNIVLAVLLIIPGVVGYNDEIDLTGSSSNDKIFYVGRITSLLVQSILLVMVYCFDEKWKDFLTLLVPRYRGENCDRMAVVAPRCPPMKPEWLLVLAFILGGAIVLDLLIVQASWLNGYMVGTMAAFFLVFVLFNACWAVSNGYSEEGKDS